VLAIVLGISGMMPATALPCLDLGAGLHPSADLSRSSGHWIVLAKSKKSKVEHQDFHFTKKVDTASPTLAKRKGKSKSKPKADYMTFEMKDATISSVKTGSPKPSSGHKPGSHNAVSSGKAHKH
jgi:type VI protein secretion system component Hcp